MPRCTTKRSHVLARAVSSNPGLFDVKNCKPCGAAAACRSRALASRGTSLPFFPQVFLPNGPSLRMYLVWVKNARKKDSITEQCSSRCRFLTCAWPLADTSVQAEVVISKPHNDNQFAVIAGGEDVSTCYSCTYSSESDVESRCPVRGPQPQSRCLARALMPSTSLF